jgi:MerR family transcriptional regulator, light-induced transcriptional regulator
MLQRFLSPKELAQAIGASESSVKRWVDEGLIAVVRTGGGHRRIALSEAIRYIRNAGLPVVQPNFLGLADLGTVPRAAADRAESQAALIEALRAGRAEEVRGLTLSAYLAGRDVAELCDGPLADAMHAVGDLWKHGAEGIYIEHRATNLCMQALYLLHTVFARPAADAPVALGGALEGDPYLLPTLMCATVLAAAGWREINLGPNLPLAALGSAVTAHRPRLVWLSCSVDTVAREREREVRKMGRALDEEGVRAVVGGRGWHTPRFGEGAGVKLVRSMAEVAAFAEGLKAANSPSPLVSRA